MKKLTRLNFAIINVESLLLGSGSIFLPQKLRNVNMNFTCGLKLFNPIKKSIQSISERL